MHGSNRGTSSRIHTYFILISFILPGFPSLRLISIFAHRSAEPESPGFKALRWSSLASRRTGFMQLSRLAMQAFLHDHWKLVFPVRIAPRSSVKISKRISNLFVKGFRIVLPIAWSELNLGQLVASPTTTASFLSSSSFSVYFRQTVCTLITPIPISLYLCMSIKANRCWTRHGKDTDKSYHTHASLQLRLYKIKSAITT